MAVEHYENFPVASILLPPHLRQPVETIYCFARSADDIADEGDLTPHERLAALAFYNRELDRIEHSETPENSLSGRIFPSPVTIPIPICSITAAVPPILSAC